MDCTTISEDFRIAIPEEAREQLNLRPGQKLAVLVHGGRIELLPIRPAEEVRGKVPDAADGFVRNDEDRF